MKIKDIAVLAGVSVATVSRVLNNNGYVSEENKEKVMKIVKEYNYVPNMQAKSLRMNSSKMIACVLPSLDSTLMMDLCSYMIKEFNQYGYTILITPLNHYPTNKEKIDVIYKLKMRGIDGIIGLFPNFSEDDYLELKKMNLPIIALNDQTNLVPVINDDLYQATYLLMNYFIQLGYKKIAYLEFEGTTWISKGSNLAYHDVLKNNSQVEKMVIHTNEIKDFYELGEDVGYQLLAYENKPEVFISISDRISVGVKNIFAANNQNIVCGGMGNSELAYSTTPRLVTIDFEPHNLAKTICEYMLKLINNEKIPMVTLNPCSLKNTID